ncbi:MAG: FAD-dependent oxidoreductase [Cyanobacteria bacterium P01_F01_bin.4]
MLPLLPVRLSAHVEACSPCSPCSPFPMPVEYDLAIIGGTPEGRTAAIAAAKTGARVALVEPTFAWQHQVHVDTLRQGLAAGVGSTWGEIKVWAQLATYAQAEQVSSAAIAAMGVDVLFDQATFQSGRLPILQTSRRPIPARGYLMATGATSHLPPIEGLATANPLSLDQLAQLETLPQRIALVGHQAMAIEWAFALAQAGVQVTWILTGDRCLIAEDVDIQRLLSQQLLAAGVQIVAQSQIDKMQQTDAQIHLWVADHPIEVDAVVIASRDTPNVAGLNLSAVGIQPSGPGVQVNRWLQTGHPRIYAVGSVLGGEDRSDLAAQEAQVAVHNALFWNRQTVAYAYTTYGLATPDEVGRVGLTEQQAYQRYGDRAQVRHSSSVPLTSTDPDKINFCKLIYLDGTQQLLGAHLIGAGAYSMAHSLAAAMRQHPITLTALAQQQPSPHTLARLVHQTAQQTASHRWQMGQWRRDWAENWFNWRRSRW